MNAKFGAVACAGLIGGFILATLVGSTSRQFRKVDALVYTTNAQEGGVERFFASPSDANSGSGQYGVNMSGYIHDGYLELAIKYDNGTETRIVPVDHISQLVFKDSN